MKHIQKNIIKIKEYKDIVDSVPKEKEEYNLYGSALNRILCMYENNILQDEFSLRTYFLRNSELS